LNVGGKGYPDRTGKYEKLAGEAIHFGWAGVRGVLWGGGKTPNEGGRN